MKKNYVKPKTVTIELDAKCVILAGSNGNNFGNGDPNEGAGVKAENLFDTDEDW